MLKTEFSATPFSTSGSYFSTSSLLKMLSVALMPTPAELNPALPQWRCRL